MNEKKLLKVEDVMGILGFGRDKTYALFRSPGFPATKVGRTMFVTRENFEEWLDKYAGREFELAM